MDEPKIKAVSITLTQSCNLACVYCYEQHKSSQIIPVLNVTSPVRLHEQEFRLL